MDQTNHDLNPEQMQQARQGGLTQKQIDLLHGVKRATNRLPQEPKVKAACEAMAQRGYTPREAMNVIFWIWNVFLNKTLTKKGPTSAAEDFGEALDRLIAGDSLLDIFPHFRAC